MINDNDLKEYNIKNLWKLKKKSLLISPTGKIYIIKQDNLNDQILMLLNKRHVNIEKVIDKIHEDLYMRGFEVSEENIKDLEHVIINFFGFIIYDYNSLNIKFPDKHYSYSEITEIQLKILSKLYKKNIKDIFSLEKGGENICKQKKFL